MDKDETGTKPGEAAEYFIVPGSKLSEEPELFTKWFVDSKFPGIYPNVLRELGFENAWQIFHEPMR